MIPDRIVYQHEGICDNCGDHNGLHMDCKKCFRCCNCVPCVQCMNVTRHICNRCIKCIHHCKCLRCQNCAAMTVKEDDLCSRCGNGKSQLCGCCGSKGKVFRQDEVNLLALAPKNNELTTNSSPRLISNEIEICGVREGNCSLSRIFVDYHCSVVHDGSLPDGGFEINTHPAGGDLYLQLIHDIGKGLNNVKAFVNERAGCHTHVDARDLGYNELAVLCKAYACTEIALYSLLPASRRVSKFCKVSGMQYMLPLLKSDKLTDPLARQAAYRKDILLSLYSDTKTKNINDLSKHKSAHNRYRGLNMHSWFHRGTIEFRIPPGMTSPRYITYWGMLLCRLVDEAKEMKPGLIQLLGETIPLMKDNQGMVENLIMYQGGLPISNKTARSMVLSSQELLLYFAPSTGVSDWLKSCFKAYNKGTDVPAY